MKLSELSRRDYIALEILAGLVANVPPELITDISDGQRGGKYYVGAAYALADRMLEVQGFVDHERAELQRRAEKAETSVSVLLNMSQADFAPKVALSQIWEFLGVKDQTAAMAKLRELLP